MRMKSVIVLLAIAFSILSPLSLHLTIAQGHASIEGLDVCHAGSLALSPGQEAPCVSEPLFEPCLPSHIDSTMIVDATPRVFLTVFPEEHPPKT
jgi:hypothetical protein